LVQEKLKEKITGVFSFQNTYMSVPVPMSTLLKMSTAADLGMLMCNLRKGTLAFIEQHQSMLTNIVSDMKGYKLKSNRREAATMMRMVMCGNMCDDNKSMKCANLREELSHAAMCGEVNVVGRTGIKNVKVNPFLHQVYVDWLIEDVLPTLSTSDARKGSLGKWHRLENWEKQLTKSIQTITPVRIMLDVADDFELAPWLEGLLSVDLDVLSDAPGVDTGVLLLVVSRYWSSFFSSSSSYMLLLLLLASVVLKFVRRSAPGGGSCSSSLSILVAQTVEVVDLSLFLVGQLQHNQTGY